MGVAFHLPGPSGQRIVRRRRIASLREERELTQEALAYTLAWEIGLASKGYLSRIESGQRLPSIDVLDRLTQHLGVEVRDLFIVPDAAMETIRVGGPKAAARVAKEIAGEATFAGRKRSSSS